MLVKFYLIIFPEHSFRELIKPELDKLRNCGLFTYILCNVCYLFIIQSVFVFSRFIIFSGLIASVIDIFERIYAYYKI